MKRNKLIALGILGGVLMIGLALSVKVIPGGKTGTRVRLGSVNETPIQEGLTLRIPLVDKIILTDNRVQKAQVEGVSASKDMQTVNNTIAVNYRISKESSSTLYKNVGITYQDTVIIPAIQESAKSIIARYTAEELITKRSEVGDSIKVELAEKLSEYGISIESINIVDFDFSEEFNKAIESKQTAQQNALKAREDLERIKVEAEQRVTQAKGEAEANKILSESISDAVLRQHSIDKWDGKLPMATGGNTPFININ